MLFIGSMVRYLYALAYPSLICQLRERTLSLWSWLLTEAAENANPLYDAASSNVVILTPSISLRRVQLWKTYYLRHNPDVAPLEQVKGALKRNWLSGMTEKTLDGLNFTLKS